MKFFFACFTMLYLYICNYNYELWPEIKSYYYSYVIFPFQLAIYHYCQELSFVHQLVNSMKLVFDKFKDNSLIVALSYQQ